MLNARGASLLGVGFLYYLKYKYHPNNAINRFPFNAQTHRPPTQQAAWSDPRNAIPVGFLGYWVSILINVENHPKYTTS